MKKLDQGIKVEQLPKLPSEEQFWGQRDSIIAGKYAPSGSIPGSIPGTSYSFPSPPGVMLELRARRKPENG